MVTGKQATPAVTLEGRAVLPADTIAPGPPAGQAEEDGAFGRKGPFPGQPVQGFSAVLPAETPGHYLVMSDNGFGAKDNSADYHLRWYEVAVDFADGTVTVVDNTELRDPHHFVLWPIVNEESRILTGADFDLESFRLAPDGTFWFGEEFGPFLLHVAADGTLLAPPISTPYPKELAPFVRNLPAIQSPEHPNFLHLSDPDAPAAAANLPSSRGFEGMAINTSGTMLYPLLEGALLDDPVRTRLLIQEFDLEANAYTGNFWYYPISDPEHAIGDMTAINECEYLVIERDTHDGEQATFKRVFAVNLCQASLGALLAKRLVVDLLKIADEKGLTTPEAGAVGLGPEFSFPFVTIESVYPVDEQTLLVINDNNYPFSSGRRPDLAPDDSEFILVRLTDLR
ncbi:MAG: esterase-like activity of phytase family protein [Chloroflexaceae bacterium]|nr:esterase-like activity of phytase family protein [Chloroflexaceae bacterium]